MVKLFANPKCKIYGDRFEVNLIPRQKLQRRTILSLRHCRNGAVCFPVAVGQVVGDTMYTSLAVHARVCVHRSSFFLSRKENVARSVLPASQASRAEGRGSRGKALQLFSSSARARFGALPETHTPADQRGGKRCAVRGAPVESRKPYIAPSLRAGKTFTRRFKERRGVGMGSQDPKPNLISDAGKEKDTQSDSAKVKTCH